jgi:hypothetical protein
MDLRFPRQYMTLQAARIPSTKHTAVASTPVLSDIHSGLQSRAIAASINCLTCLFLYSTFVSK